MRACVRVVEVCGWVRGVRALMLMLRGCVRVRVRVEARKRAGPAFSVDILCNSKLERLGECRGHRPLVR